MNTTEKAVQLDLLRNVIIYLSYISKDMHKGYRASVRLYAIPLRAKEQTSLDSGQ